jgi:hypothetical protein
MEDFNKISLGFAEFVSQLLHETFEAALSAQNYQIEKYIEIENILKLSNTRYFDLYLNTELLKERSLDIFGVEVKNQMTLNPEIVLIIENLFEDVSDYIKSNKLTNNGFKAIKEYVLTNLVSERKNVLQSIINKTEFSRLIIDSGEIKAKLELTNLYQDKSLDDEKLVSLKANSTKKSEDEKSNVFSSKSVLFNNIKMTEIKDSKTNEKILVIDKSTISDKSNFTYSLPNVRITAKPATVSSNNNLLSEVIIKFKTV